jgi:hypothetical protein
MSFQQSDQQAEKWAEIIRSILMHESEVMNHRITWLVTIQGLLFTGLGFAWDKRDAKNLVVIFSVLGILVAASASTVLSFSMQASRDLVQWWNEHKPPHYIGPDVIGGQPASAQQRGVLWLLRPWRSLPWIFAFGWLMIIIINFQRS